MIPWIELEYGKEFRLFIHDNKLTAISQQHLYTSNPILSKLNTIQERETAGSALYHWIIDDAILTGKQLPSIHFRYAL